MKALHLNLLHPSEQHSMSPVRLRVLLPVIAGSVAFFVLLWGAFVGIELAMIKSKVAAINSAIGQKSGEAALSGAWVDKLKNATAEADQYAFYLHGRQTRSELLKRIAFAIPEGVTLSTLQLPPPPEQELRRPLGSKLPALQGPTQTVECVELRLSGLAQSEQDVFQMMRAFESDAFTGLVSVVKHQIAGQKESPRVLAFRQEAPQLGTGRRDVFFDIVYDITPREFVK